jgi:hypothetical protein
VLHLHNTNPKNKSNMTTATTRIKFQFDGIKTQIQLAPDGLGNGLFTTSEFAPGEPVVLIKRPFVAVLDTPQLKDSCSGCFTVVDDTSVSSTNEKENEDLSSSLKTCTGCKVVKYCNKVCLNSISFKDFLKTTSSPPSSFEVFIIGERVFEFAFVFLLSLFRGILK